MRYVPYNLGRSDKNAVSQTISTAMAVFICIAVIILVFSISAAETIARFFKGGPQLAKLIQIMGIAAAIECPFRIFDAAIRAHERWITANIITITRAVLRAVGLVICVSLGFGITQMGIVVVIVSIFALVSAFITFKRYFPDVKMKISMISLSSLKTLLGFGIFATISTLAYTLKLPGHNMIIGKLISLEAVTLYVPAILIIKNVRQAVIAPIKVFWPRFAYLDGNGNSKKVASLFFKAAKTCSIFASGIIFIAMVTAPPFIKLWLGDRFNAVIPAFMILACGYLIETSFAVSGSLLSGTGHQKAEAAVSAVEAFAGLMLSIIFAKKFGLAGIAMGLLISVFVTQGIIRLCYICYLLKINPLKYYANTILKPYLLLIVLLFFAKITGISDSINTWLALFLLGSFLVIIYVFSVYCFVINQQMRLKAQAYMLQILNPLWQLIASKTSRQKL